MASLFNTATLHENLREVMEQIVTYPNVAIPGANYTYLFGRRTGKCTAGQGFIYVVPQSDQTSYLTTCQNRLTLDFRVGLQAGAATFTQESVFRNQCNVLKILLGYGGMDWSFVDIPISVTTLPSGNRSVDPPFRLADLGVLGTETFGDLHLNTDDECRQLTYEFNVRWTMAVNKAGNAGGVTGEATEPDLCTTLNIRADLSAGENGKTFGLTLFYEVAPGNEIPGDKLTIPFIPGETLSDFNSRFINTANAPSFQGSSIYVGNWIESCEIVGDYIRIRYNCPTTPRTLTKIEASNESVSASGWTNIDTGSLIDSSS